MFTVKVLSIYLTSFLFLLILHSAIFESLSRAKRFLIFPRAAPTRHQFIGGIGIPADLTYESLTSGWVLKAEYWLPFNATVFRENPFFPEYKNDLKNINDHNHFNQQGREFSKMLQKPSEIRWHIYEFLMNRLQSYGYNGSECLLKAICEANSIPFERNINVFAEVMNILFSPSSSKNVNRSDSANFIEAEKYGRLEGNCDIYACELSLMNIISHIIHNK